MAHFTRDVARSTHVSGLLFALTAAAAFGLAGTLARGLMDLGWSAGAATLARTTISAATLAPATIWSMRGQWRVLRTAWPTVLVFGIFAVAGAQYFYFMSVQRLDVGVALLIEYLAPLGVVAWMWLSRGQRPTRLTLAGAAVAFAGLIALLDFTGGAVDMVGVTWALAAMVGATIYYVVGGNTELGMPPVALAGGGLTVAAAVMALAAVTGIVPISTATGTVQFNTAAIPWWLALVVLGVITSALAYFAGIEATRRLGSRLASFVALIEVLAASGFAWVLLGQAFSPMQWLGATLVLAGVVVVKLGEPTADAPDDAPLSLPAAAPHAHPEPAR